MAGFRRWKLKDVDNRWFEFDEQQERSSCGPTCVKILKQSTNPMPISEEYMRTVTALFKHGMDHQGVILVPTATHNWDTRGSNRDDLLKALKAPPTPMPEAKIVEANLAAAILGANRHHPTMLFARWPNGNAHWVVSMGRLPSNAARATILDPWYGLAYIDTTVLDGQWIKYRTGSIRWGITT